VRDQLKDVLGYDGEVPLCPATTHLCQEDDVGLKEREEAIVE
jgi:hypothetical protein